MADYLYRVHPAIGIARVGNSEEYYIGPETAAGLPLPGQPNNPARGGLPINPATNATITSKDLRDANGAFKRQAARFRIFQYPNQNLGSYPTGQGTEIEIGSTLNGKTVKDIIWTVHLANKKANTYVLVEDPPTAGIVAYENGNLPPLRNLSVANGNPNDPARITMLTIDAGPRTISGSNTGSVKFDQATTASIYQPGTGIVQLGNYPKSFPGDSFKNLYCPTGPIDTLGEVRTDAQGHLLVLGGYGRACGWNVTPPYLNDDVNNDNWFDDASDGPVSAVLILDDGSVQPVQVGAWVTATDPGYAPQTLNIVSLWDDIYDAWVRNLALAPAIYSQGSFQTSYQPPFPDQLQPIFQSVALQQWNINLSAFGIDIHNQVGLIEATTVPSGSVIDPITSYIRNPNDSSQWSLGPPLMPGSLGDSNQDFLVLSQTQYFFLQQWQNNNYSQGPGPALGPGEYLDKVVLQNCLGGRFSPGIDLTFIVRQPDLYIKDWQTSAGPFRIKPAPLDYNGVQKGVPLLTEGYVPLHSGNTGVEPGDICKFMAIPWHTDYNSCATHPPTGNPVAGTTLFWSWPAQRPVAVYPAKLNPSGPPTKQLWSVRGPGTSSLPYPQNWGRYQDRINIVLNWHRIGVVLQGTAIDGGDFGADVYLEVESLLEDSGDPVVPYPNKYVVPPD
jgi:L-Lysine epsilon oxidase N-terminal/L-lysine epsilon oxidase C-terminal domain